MFTPYNNFPLESALIVVTKLGQWHKLVGIMIFKGVRVQPERVEVGLSQVKETLSQFSGIKEIQGKEPEVFTVWTCSAAKLTVSCSFLEKNGCVAMKNGVFNYFGEIRNKVGSWIRRVYCGKVR